MARQSIKNRRQIEYMEDESRFGIMAASGSPVFWFFIKNHGHWDFSDDLTSAQLRTIGRWCIEAAERMEEQK